MRPGGGSKKTQQLEEDFAKAEKSTPVIAGDGKPCLRKLQERMSDLMGIPLDKAWPEFGMEGLASCKRTLVMRYAANAL